MNSGSEVKWSPVAQQIPKMTEVRLSLGINVSILVILMIFAVLLSLPLRLLFNTNYYSVSENEVANSQGTQNESRSGINATTALLIPRPDFRKVKRCPRFPYEDRMKSIFVSDYDKNCTYVRVVVKMKKTERSKAGSVAKPEAGGKQEKRKKSFEKETTERKESREEGADKEITKVTESEAETAINTTKDPAEKDSNIKQEDKDEPVSVSSHILVAMLVVSGLFAFVEVLRIRLSKDKDHKRAVVSFKKHKDTSRGSTIGPGRSSVVDLPVVSRFAPKAPMISQRSFEMQGMHRSTLRLLGAKPPPLIRRSSFPTQEAKHIVSPLISGTSTSRAFRRPSIDSETDVGAFMTVFHHRTHMIRRH